MKDLLKERLERHEAITKECLESIANSLEHLHKLVRMLQDTIDSMSERVTTKSDIIVKQCDRDGITITNVPADNSGVKGLLKCLLSNVVKQIEVTEHDTAEYAGLPKQD